jgi:HAD domain in Swiss Army Knife RNA repair proteins
MKVIFLDIDGPLNPNENIYRIKNRKQKLGQPGHVTLKEQEEWLPRACENFNKIIEATNALVVISSTWRQFHSITELQALFIKNNVRGLIYGITPIEHNSALIVPGATRGSEIGLWLQNHQEVDRYVILDDDSDMLITQLPFFVHISTGVGITAADAQKAINILNNTDNEQ